MAEDNHSNDSITLRKEDLAVIDRALAEITGIALALKGLSAGIYSNPVGQTDEEIMAMAIGAEVLAGKAGWLVDICLKRLGNSAHGNVESWLMPAGCRVFVSKTDKREVANG